MEILILFAVMGYATGAGAARHLHASEFDPGHPRHLPEERARRAAVMLLWPIVLPIMLGILLSRRSIAKVKAKVVEKDRLSAAGGIRLGPEIKIQDDDTYRRLLIATQQYEKEKGYNG